MTITTLTTIPIRIPALPCPDCHAMGQLHLYPFGGVPIIRCRDCAWQSYAFWAGDAADEGFVRTVESTIELTPRKLDDPPNLPVE